MRVSCALSDAVGFRAALAAARLPRAQDFSVAETAQFVEASTLAEIAAFIQVFDRVTAREAWRAAALAEAPPTARMSPGEVCVFSAWDFHLPPEGAPQLIEFNDAGAGFLFAAIVNALFYDAAGLARDPRIVPPPTVAAFHDRLGRALEAEAAAFFGARPDGLALILDDRSSLDHGRFRGEHALFSALLAGRGWETAIGAADQTRYDGKRLTVAGRPVALVVNRSTDFFWSAPAFAALRRARAERAVYAAPNPFTYATRSDKGLLAWLSSPERDAELGVTSEERRILSAHVPETRILVEANVDELAQDKGLYVFKPRRGFASHGLIDSAAIGRARLKHLVRSGKDTVAQRRIEKPWISADGRRLWTDLRVWAWRGEILALSGRASLRPDRLDLAPPGGWIATYALAGSGAFDPSQTPDGSSALSFRQSGGGPQRPPTRTSGGT